MDGGAWWVTVHGVAKSQTRLSDFTISFPDGSIKKNINKTSVYIQGKGHNQNTSGIFGVLHLSPSSRNKDMVEH